MATTRNLRCLSIAATCLACLAATSVWAAGGRSSATAGHPANTGEHVEVDFPGIASASDDFEDPATGIGQSATAVGSPGGLSVFARATGWDNIAPRYGAGASFSSVEDTTFNYQPDYQGGMDDWVEVGLTGVLSGAIVGSGRPYCFFGCTPESAVGAGYARARVSISGPIYSAPPEEGGVLLGSASADTGAKGGFVTSGQSIDFNEFVSTGYFWVPRGQPVSFTASLSVEMGSSKNPFGKSRGDHGTVTANFADTFKFDPYNFFDIRTPGITANSPALGIVNNQLPAFIPEPASAALWLLAGLAVLATRRFPLHSRR